MARGNRVGLTFTGDTKNLDNAFSDVGKSSKRMKKDVGDSFDRVGESADNLDTRAMGFRDTMTGVEDTGRGVSEIMKGNLFDGVLLLGMGFGDLASGVANFGVQFAKTAVQTVGNWAKMAAASTASAIKMAAAWIISLGPVALVIAGIAAVIAIALALGIGFDDLKVVAQNVWNFILDAAMSVKNWLQNNWPLILAILTGPFGLAVLAIVRFRDDILNVIGAVPGWIAGAFGTLADIISSPFRIAFQAIKNLWNSTVGGFGFSIPSWVPGLGGRSFRIPSMQLGGIVPGTPGMTVPILAEAGERVSRLVDQGGPSMEVIRIEIDGRILAEVVRDRFVDLDRRAGR